jgi:zinc transporter 1/2/3
MFQNECIGELAFESTAAAIALAAAFVTFLFDLIGSRVAHRHMLPSDHHTTGSDSPSVNQEKNARLAAIPHDDDAHAHNVDAAFMAEQNWQVLLLEAGIIFHS